MGHTPRSRWVKSLAAIAAGGLALTACSSGSSGGTTSSSAGGGAAGSSSAASSAGSATGSSSASSSGGEAASGGVVTGVGGEPQNPLIATNTNETGGGDILVQIFAGLVYYEPDGTPQNDMAESITTTDSQNYDVKLKTGQKFTNGETVTSDSFIDAWNYGAAAANAQLNTSWFDSIAGYADVANCGDGNPVAEGQTACATPPKATTLSGLKKVSDTEFTIALSAPASDFPLRLGYAAWFPLSKAGLADMKAEGENPISNGPYKVAKWDHGQQIQLVANPDYQGARKPQNAGVTLVFYPSYDAAYADLLSDNLDVINNIPASSLASFESDLGDRAVNQPNAVFQSFTIPGRLPHWSGDEGNLRRQAVSYAINRPEITQVIFNNTRTPAVDWLAPTINGYSDSLSGAGVLKYDEAKAKDLWAQADAISPWGATTFELAYNQNGGHKEWVEAVTNGLNNVLPGINAAPKEYAVFGEFRTAITDRSITTPFRTGWQFDYPGPYNALKNIYYTDAGSNDGDYSNADFDKLVDAGIAAPDVDAGNKKFQDAEEILFKDLPAIPLWYSNITGGFSTKVGNVKFGWDGVPIYYAVTKEA